MTRPIQLTIHTAALKHNYQLAKLRAPQSRAFAVIKANAYGHGMQRVATALADADGFALLEIDQALALRQSGVSKPILLLEGVFSAEELKTCAAHNLMVALHHEQQLAWLESTALQRPVHAFLKLNTGMNRLGFVAERAAELAQRLSPCSNLASLGVMSHFSCADEASIGIAAQRQRFFAAVDGLNLPISLANSAAILDYPEVACDWVRPGLMLYGASPFAERSAKDLGLQAAMSLRSQIISTQVLQTGDCVGYGAQFCADRTMRIGTVACGYADGYPRHAPTGTPVWLAGRLTRLLGRVSMDMLAIDLTDFPDVAEGASVELWGRHLPIDVVAKAASTISYELMCAISSRVPVITD